MRQYRRGERAKVFAAYGGPICKCCGETTYEFLAMDHINGGGRAARAVTGGGVNFYRWLIRNNFPEGYQVLCHNCNSAKGYYGTCPHQRVVAGVA